MIPLHTAPNNFLKMLYVLLPLLTFHAVFFLYGTDRAFAVSEPVTLVQDTSLGMEIQSGDEIIKLRYNANFTFQSNLWSTAGTAHSRPSMVGHTPLTGQYTFSEYFPSKKHLKFTGFGISYARSNTNSVAEQTASFVNTDSSKKAIRYTMKVTNTGYTDLPVNISFGHWPGTAGTSAKTTQMTYNTKFFRNIYNNSKTYYLHINPLASMRTPEQMHWKGGYLTALQFFPLAQYPVGKTITDSKGGEIILLHGTKTVPPGGTVEESLIVSPEDTVPYLPSLVLTTPAQGTTTKVSSGGSLNLAGNVSGVPSGKTVTIKYRYDNLDTKTLTTYTSTSTSAKTFSSNVTVPSLSTGNHTVDVWAETNEGWVSGVETRDLEVEPSLAVPNAPTITELTPTSTKATWTHTPGVSGTITYELQRSMPTAAGTSTTTVNTGTSKTYTYNNASSIPSNFLHNSRGAYSVRAYLGTTVTAYSPVTYSYGLLPEAENIYGEIPDGIKGPGYPKIAYTYIHSRSPLSAYVLLKPAGSTSTYATITRYPVSNGYTSPDDFDYATKITQDTDIYVYALNGDSVATPTHFIGTYKVADTTPPTATHTLTPSSWTKNDVVIKVTASDADSGIESIRNPAGTYNYSTTSSYTVSSNGTYTFVIKDKEGNTLTYPVSVTNIDKVNPNDPTLSLNTTSNTSELKFTASSNGDVGSGVSRIEYRLNGGSWMTYSSQTTVPPSYTGSVKVEVRVVDNVGNYSNIVTKTGYVDNLPPTAVHTLSPSSWTNQDVLIRVTASDNEGVYSIKDKNNSTTYGTVAQLTVSSNGTYQFVITDTAGNVLNYNVSVSNIDKVAPGSPTMSINKSTWAAPPVTFTMAHTGDNLSGVAYMEYRLDGGTWTKYTGTTTIPSSYGGEVMVEGRVIDNAGNISALNSVTGYIDDQPPVIDDFYIEETGNAQPKNYQAKVIAQDRIPGSGLPASPYRFYQKIIGQDNDFVLKTGWQSSNTYAIPKSPSSTILSYKVDVRDIAELVSTTVEKHHLTAPILDYANVKDENNPNTAKFVFSNPIGENVTVRVYRDDEYIKSLPEGTTVFEDGGLDYERTFEYKFVATSSTGTYGNLTSDDVKVSVTIQKPSIEMNLAKDHYKTIFTDEYDIKGKLTYRRGGDVALTLSKNGTVVAQEAIYLDAFVPYYWMLHGTEESLESVPLRVNYDFNVTSGEQDVVLHTRDVTFDPIRESLANVLYQ